MAKGSDESGVMKRRAEIDEIDMALLQLIARRRDIALEIAKIKQKIGSADDEQRLKDILDKVQKRAEELGLDPEEMKSLWKSMIAYMIREQMKKYPY